ncbi:MAG TPA: T9SS type A sorting domain-containing protein [Prolixibacteraceae bacterium]|nr:T9SS type A sorting domain-containing protein [Prolixibacteraceae bacterium]HOS89296.1 T9SS type A sorting domain-containing protein [Prolixibacteraceae bacterium]HPL45653.1 T9SS type A sorting domain-containing protein [Prolixibacteraceae bacterium]HQE52018.1 T9SS type A sorting domain-containing protein [Prolixibacteraceae bacterium]HQH76354.1 T9SS type A sorting domain-containing protein [Prolixibacteraceae bacterium]
MKNFYVCKKVKPGFVTGKVWRLTAALLLFLSLSGTAFAQVAQTWTGAENTRFTNENNWDPAGSPVGNNLTIPLKTDSTQAPFQLLVSGTDNISVNWLEVAYATDNQYQPTVTIELDEDTAVFNVVTGSASNCDYQFTGTIVKKGHYTSLKSNVARLDEVNSWLRVEGGIAEFRNLLMGNSNSPSRGGKIYVSGGELIVRDGFGRMWTGRAGGQVEITKTGKVTVRTNFTPPTENWINGGEDYLIKRTYDAVFNVTTFTALHKDSVFDVLNAETQVLVFGEATDTLRLMESGILSSPTLVLTWKYRKEGELAFKSFTGPGADAKAFAPVFSEPGTYFVICEGVDGAKVVQTSQVMFLVASDAITLSPKIDMQYVRIGETGVEITAIPAGGTWKYSRIQGGPYMAMDSTVTGGVENKLSPVFKGPAGNYYLVYETEIGGKIHRSYEMLYIIEAANSAGKTLTWTGRFSNDANFPANWTPVANPYNNTLNVNAFDSASVLPYPVFAKPGNFAISSFTFAPNSRVTFDGPDTISTTGSNRYVQGTVDLIKGVMTARPTENNQYFRIERPEAVFTLHGTSKLWVYNLLMGSHSSPTAGTGGHLHIKDNATVICSNIDRFCTVDSTYSRVYLYDNGQIHIAGDVRSAQQARIEMGKYLCPVEDWEPFMFFDGEYTILKARNTKSFSIADAKNAYTTANTPLEEAVTLINVEGITAWEWKWSLSPHGPWNSFDPPATNLPAINPSFSESGSYFVIAETSEGVQTSNFKPVTVIELGITPDASQEIGLNVNGDTLNAVVPAQFTVTSVSWYYRLAGSEDYVDTYVTGMQYVPNFGTVGVYEVFYVAEVQDEFSVQYFLISNSVTITAGNVGIRDNRAEFLNIYPNPTTGLFYVDGGHQEYRLEIFDLTGKVLMSRQLTDGGRQTINFNRKGMFIVKVQSGDELKIGRLIVH